MHLKFNVSRAWPHFVNKFNKDTKLVTFALWDHYANAALAY